MSKLKELVIELNEQKDYHLRQADAYADAITKLQVIGYLENGKKGTVVLPIKVKKTYTKKAGKKNAVSRKRKQFPIRFGKAITDYLEKKEDHTATGASIKAYLEEKYGEVLVKKQWKKKIRIAINSMVYLKNASVQLSVSGDILDNVYSGKK